MFWAGIPQLVLFWDRGGAPLRVQLPLNVVNVEVPPFGQAYVLLLALGQSMLVVD